MLTQNEEQCFRHAGRRVKAKGAVAGTNAEAKVPWWGKNIWETWVCSALGGRSLLLWKPPAAARQNQAADPSSLTGFQLWKSPVTPSPLVLRVVLQFFNSLPLLSGQSWQVWQTRRWFFIYVHADVLSHVSPQTMFSFSLMFGYFIPLIFQILQFYFPWGERISGVFPTRCPLLAMEC